MATSTQVNYESGDTYSGGLSEFTGRKSGLGKLQLGTGEEYCGMFENGVFQGLGVLTLGSNSSYKGEFHDGKYNGLGVLADIGATFYGVFLNGQPTHGRLEAKPGRQVICVDGQFSGNGSFLPAPNQNFPQLVIRAKQAAVLASDAANRFTKYNSYQ